jgi:hypothetical protein
MKQPESRSAATSKGGLSQRQLALLEHSRTRSRNKFKPGTPEWAEERQDGWLDSLIEFDEMQAAKAKTAAE